MKWEDWSSYKMKPTTTSSGETIQLLKQTEDGYETLAEKPYQQKGVHLKIEARSNRYHFSYSEDGEEFESLFAGVDAIYLYGNGLVALWAAYTACMLPQTLTKVIILLSLIIWN